MGSIDFTLPVLGVDTGGTFTDFVLVDGGRVRTWKVPSTPSDPSQAVLEGTRHLLGDRNALVFHGSTVATNALLEKKGARVALVTTEGFRDLLAIGRQSRPQLYSLHPRRPPSLVPRHLTVEARERIFADGVVETPLTESEIDRVVASVASTGAVSVAICLLHSYASSIHEDMLAEALESAGFSVSRSAGILPEYREFERASTTVVNAAVSPVMATYLGRLQAGLGERPLRIMQSSGGAISATAAGVQAVRTILSGPAGGMVGAFATAKRAGFDRIITFDMGGTSTDVGLCPGEIPFTGDTVVAGWPVKVPMIDIHTVGAGGGSIARIDAGGALRVGPESAGADPGPACYGKGEEATVTDANLCLGRLLPERFLGGRMRLDQRRAAAAVEKLARHSGITLRKAAEGILEVAEGTMAGALRVVSVARGYDPGEFVLVPFGGAGGLHACSLAENLGIERILVPLHPGLLSAAGLVMSDVVRDYSLSVLRPGDTPAEEIETLFLPLQETAVAEMETEGISREMLSLHPSVDLRYRGQSFEINVPFSEDFGGAFHARHQALYGYRDEKRSLEIVTLRLRAVGPGPRPDFAPPVRDGEKGGGAAASTSVIIDGSDCRCPVYLREDLPDVFAGPALVVEETATHLIRPGWKGSVDRFGNLILERR